MITKLDIAFRQLKTAILLRSRGADPVSICTLAGAAAGIAHDVCKARDIKSFRQLAVEAHPNHRPNEIWGEFTRIPNSYKHANKDTESMFPLPTDDEVEMLLYEAAHDIQLVMTFLDPVIPLYVLWFRAARPDLFSVLEVEEAKKEFHDLSVLSKNAQLKLLDVKLDSCLKKHSA